MKLLPTRAPLRGRIDRTAGFTLADVVVAMLLLTMAAGGLTGAVTHGLRLNRVNEETAAADEAARAMVEQIQATPFDQRFAVHSAQPDFAVPRLNVQKDDEDGMAGKILFPTIDGELREDVVDANLGMPRDLSGDGIQDVQDHSGDYVLLPVTVRIEWTGPSGDRSHQVHLLMVQ